jgi:chitinase
MKKLVLLFLITLSSRPLLSQTCKEVIGYYPNWQWYDRAKLVKPSTIAYSKYTIINYSFFKPEASGLISNTDAWADENLLQGQINWSTNPTSYYPNTSIIDLAHNAGTKVMVSIGGWTLSDNFPSIAANSSKRALFASECNRLLKFYNFDGIDIDWEYPGFADHSGTANDKQNFTLLLQQIKDSITTLGIQNNKTYKLSACFSADPTKADDIEWNNIVPILDMINLMSYDFFGAFDCKANHNSPLYAPTSGDPNFNIHSAFNMLTTTYNVPSNKINIGTAFYGRSQTGATTLHQTTNCGEDAVTFSLDLGTPQYYNVVDKLNLFDYHWDNVAKVPYLTGKSSGSAAGTFVSYDNKQSIGMKAEYIVNNNARGTIIWEITGDYLETAPGSGVVASTPLIDTMNYVFCHTTVTGVNQLSNEKEEDFTIYPNPNNGAFNLQYSEEENASISILDIKGAVLHFQKIFKGENKINTSNLSQGLYLIKLENQTGVFFKKVMID